MITRLRALGHQVADGPWPFYRLMALAMFIGSIQQLRFGPPESLRAATPTWYDPIWLTMMMIASVLIIIAIGIMGETIRSAHVEIGGLIMLIGSQTIYIVGYLKTVGQPQSWLTCVPYAVLIFAIFRVRKLRHDIKDTIAELDGGP